jgi:thiosulfate dehydrogenase [quinone] large subunit
MMEYEELAFKPRSFHIAFTVLRIILGGSFLEAGIDKAVNGFSAAGYLEHGTGPLAGWFASLANYDNVLDPLVIVTEILIGLALITGTLVKPASAGGIIMMILYYLPYLPSSNGWINEQMVYIFILLAIILSGTGYFIGHDRFGVRLELDGSPLRWLFG